MDKRVVDITGQRFGKLTAIEKVKIPGKLHAYWRCKCDCGNESVVCGSNLRKGGSKSCGCSINQYNFIQLKKNRQITDYNENLKIRLEQKSKWNEGCLEWQPNYRTRGDRPTLGKDGKKYCGYGLLRYKKKMMLAHRASWLVHNGEIPEGKLVLHHCDNPLCINIKHLYLGTHQDNSDHKIARRRAPNQGKGRRKKTLLRMKENDTLNLS